MKVLFRRVYWYIRRWRANRRYNKLMEEAIDIAAQNIRDYVDNDILESVYKKADEAAKNLRSGSEVFQSGSSDRSRNEI